MMILSHHLRRAVASPAIHPLKTSTLVQCNSAPRWSVTASIVRWRSSDALFHGDDRRQQHRRRRNHRHRHNDDPPDHTVGNESLRNPNLVSLNKIMAQRGLCSRKEADAYLAQGWIRLNGQVLNKREHLWMDPAQITENDTLELTKEASQDQNNKSTILLHKPAGIVSGQPESDDQIPAVQLLTADRQYLGKGNINNNNNNINNNTNNYHPRYQKGWATAGRLDAKSTGLLVLTQSGKVVNQIIHAESNMEKEYLVGIAGGIVTDLEQRLQQLRAGVRDGNDVLRVASVDQVYKTQLRVVLTQGKKHHIRRMFQAVQLPVRTLKRVRIGKVVLGNLPPGTWRYLGRQERFV